MTIAKPFLALYRAAHSDAGPEYEERRGNPNLELINLKFQLLKLLVWKIFRNRDCHFPSGSPLGPT